jgi:hypothetical protein
MTRRWPYLAITRRAVHGRHAGDALRGFRLERVAGSPGQFDPVAAVSSYNPREHGGISEGARHADYRLPIKSSSPRRGSPMRVATGVIEYVIAAPVLDRQVTRFSARRTL